MVNSECLVPVISVLKRCFVIGSKESSTQIILENLFVNVLIRWVPLRDLVLEVVMNTLNFKNTLINLVNVTKLVILNNLITTSNTR